MAPRRSTRKSSVAVTGAAGFVAERLLNVLCADDRVERVVGFDVRVPSFTHAKFVFDDLDVRDPAIEGRLQGIDVLVHLAFIMDPIRDETFMRDVNVNGSQTVFKSAGRAGVKKVVYTSSAVVYGAHPDNRIPLDEEAPLRANLDFSYAAHKLEVEFVVGEVQEEFPNLKMTVLRPAIVFGPHVNNAWSHSLELPVLFGVQGYASPLQFVHEDDLADAIAHTVFNDLPGVYNVAAPGWLEADEMMAILDRRRFELPEPVAFGLVERLWAAGLAEAPAGMLHYVMHPWIVSTEKLAAAGFTAKHSNLEVFKSEAERAKDHVRIGRRRLSRGRILQGGVAGLGLVGAVAAARFLRRRSLTV